MAEKFQLKAAVSSNFAIEYQKILGEGSYAKVYEATCKADGSPRAAKVMKSEFVTGDGMVKTMFESECRYLASCEHANIIKTDGMFKKGKIYIIILESCKGGNLEDKICASGFYTEATARRICRGIASAVKHLHDRDIVHCDIKPGNILLATNCNVNDEQIESDIRLTDFGFSAVDTLNSLSHLSGSPPFHAPELVQHVLYGKAVDVWAFGVTMYYLLSGEYPFSIADGQQELNRQILEKEVDFPEPKWANVSTNAKQLLRRLLTKDMYDRISIDDVVNDSWFTSEGSSMNVQLGIQNAMIESRKQPKMLGFVNRYFFAKKFVAKLKLRRAQAVQAVLALATPPDIVENGPESLALPENYDSDNDDVAPSTCPSTSRLQSGMSRLPSTMSRARSTLPGECVLKLVTTDVGGFKAERLAAVAVDCLEMPADDEVGTSAQQLLRMQRKTSMAASLWDGAESSAGDGSSPELANLISERKEIEHILESIKPEEWDAIRSNNESTIVHIRIRASLRGLSSAGLIERMLEIDQTIRGDNCLDDIKANGNRDSDEQSEKIEESESESEPEPDTPLPEVQQEEQKEVPLRKEEQQSTNQAAASVKQSNQSGASLGDYLIVGAMIIVLVSIVVAFPVSK